MRGIPIRGEDASPLNQTAKLDPKLDPESEEEPVVIYEPESNFKLEEILEQEEEKEYFGMGMAILAVLVFAIVLLFFFKDRIREGIIGLINKSVLEVVT